MHHYWHAPRHGAKRPGDPLLIPSIMAICILMLPTIMITLMMIPAVLGCGAVMGSVTAVFLRFAVVLFTQQIVQRGIVRNNRLSLRLGASGFEIAKLEAIVLHQQQGIGALFAG